MLHLVKPTINSKGLAVWIISHANTSIAGKLTAGYSTNADLGKVTPFKYGPICGIYDKFLRGTPGNLMDTKEEFVLKNDLDW